jgi:group I intron endonuclease
MLIYRATNKINNKAYIGLAQDFEVRKNKHIADAESGVLKYYFYNAMRKYGAESFEWDILAECDTREEASDLEVELIAKHDTFHNGYNSTTGGERGWDITDETRAKMSESQTGRKHTKATRTKMSESAKGKPKTKEQKKKQSLAMSGKTPWNKGKTGVQVAWNKGKTGYKCKKRGPRSEETKRKIAESVKKRHAEGCYTGA